MILDDLSRLTSYAAWCPALEQVARFMATHQLEQLPDGRVELPEIGGFVNIQTIGVKTPGQARLESHRRMIDVQVPLTGDEEMGLTPLAQAAPAPYDEERDLSFHEGAPTPCLRCARACLPCLPPPTCMLRALPRQGCARPCSRYL